MEGPLPPKGSNSFTCSIIEWGRVGLHKHYYDIQTYADSEIMYKQPSRVFSGSSHSIMITVKGDLYSWGSNSCGQLGHGDQEKHRFQPIRKFSMLKAYANDIPMQVEIGKDYTLVLTKDGFVYSWGLGDQGQLGNLVDDEQAVAISKLNGGGLLLDVLLNTTNQDGSSPWNMTNAFPKRVILPQPISMIACGSAHSIALTRDTGEIFVWGSNKYGQLGIGNDNLYGDCNPNNSSYNNNYNVNNSNNNVTNVYSPRKLISPNLGQIVMIAAGSAHTLALGSNRTQLYSWGRGSDGQLGLGSKRNCSTPKEISPFIKQLDTIKSITCGQFSSFAITSFKEVYSWGQGVSLGHADFTDQLSPKLINDLLGKGVEYISAGFSHSLAHTSKGECYAFGQGDYGQLGLGESISITVTPKLVTQLEPYFIEHISSGWWNSTAIITPRNDHYYNKNSSKVSLSSSDAILKRTSSSNGLNRSISISSFNLSDSMLNLEKLLIEYDVQKSLEMINQLDNEINSDHSNESDDLTSSMVIIDPEELSEHVDLKQKRIVHSIGSFYDKFINIFKDKPTIDLTLDIDKDLLSKIWLDKFLPRWDKCFGRKEWRPLWRRGIPPDIRPLVWSLSIGNKLGFTREKYEEYMDIVDQFLKYEESRKDQSDSDNEMDSDLHDMILEHDNEQRTNHKQIPAIFKQLHQTMSMLKIDLPRTFPHLHLFNRHGPYHKQMTNLLLCWTIHRPTVGYVQGMTYLAGLFCLHWEPYECFVAFTNMVNTHYFTSLFMMDVSQIVKHIKIFDILYQRYLPELHAQFRRLGFSSEHYLLEWFLTLFTKQLPLSVVARIWDCYLFEGETFIYATALGILKCCQKLIISSTFDESALLLRSLPQDIKEEALFSAIQTIHIPKYFKKLVEILNKETFVSTVNDTATL